MADYGTAVNKDLTNVLNDSISLSLHSASCYEGFIFRHHAVYLAVPGAPLRLQEGYSSSKLYIYLSFTACGQKKICSKVLARFGSYIYPWGNHCGSHWGSQSTLWIRMEPHPCTFWAEEADPRWKACCWKKVETDAKELSNKDFLYQSCKISIIIILPFREFG